MSIIKEKVHLYIEHSTKISKIYDEHLESFEKNKKAFSFFLKECGCKGYKGKAGFYGGCNSPLKRLMQYKDLFHTIYNKTLPEHPDKEICHLSYVEWNQIAIDVDKHSGINKLQSIDQLIKLFSLFPFLFFFFFLIFYFLNFIFF